MKFYKVFRLVSWIELIDSPTTGEFRSYVLLPESLRPIFLQECRLNSRRTSGFRDDEIDPAHPLP